MLKTTTAHVSASGQVISQPCVVKSVNLLAGADAATVKLYDGTIAAGRPLRAALGEAANLSDSIVFPDGVRFKTGVYAVVTGTAPSVIVGIESPQANS